MANDTGSTRRSNDDESNRSGKRFVNGKDLSTSDFGTTNSSGLKSSRETSLRKQITSSPSSTRKADRLEKWTPTMPPLKKKSEGIEKHRMLSPLRSSDVGNKYTLSNFLGSKKFVSSGSSDMKKIEKSVNQLATEARRVNQSEKYDLNPVGRKRKRLDARSYKSLFKLGRKDTVSDVDEELERSDKLSQVDSSDDGGNDFKQIDNRVGRGDDRSGKLGEELREECIEGASAGEKIGNHVEEEFSYSSRKHRYIEETYKPSDGDGIEASKSGSLVTEPLADAKRVVVNDGDIDFGSCRIAMTSKQKKDPTEMDFDGSAMIAKEDIHTTVSDAVSPSSSGCKNLVELCVACSKRLRVHQASAKEEFCSCNTISNRDFCDTSILEGRKEFHASATTRNAEEFDGGTPWKETPLNVQMDDQENECAICKLGGKLLCCYGKGCQRSYHVSCLDPPLADVPPGVWHCFWCVNKKIESGVYSVSRGVESIWDAREVDVSDAEGLPRQKQYFVKYKGLAHIHNQWVPETQLLLEAPLLVAKFNRKNQVMKWNVEWTVPHRLLKKRMLIYPKQQYGYHSGHANDLSDCHFEWLVKWRALDYEHATWELENVSFLRSSRGLDLVREYENRGEKAKRSTLLVDEIKKESIIRLSKLPAGGSFEMDSKYLYSVNKLLEYWHKGQNAVIIEDQERMRKVVLFIQSLSEKCQPFLIIATSNVLSSWEAEFLRLAPSIHVVNYCGNIDTRRSIRTLEFYEERGHTVFQVLLSPPEAVVEDLEMLECLRWEAVIMDECQRSRISYHLEQFKKLATRMRLLIFSAQIKESIAGYLNLLSLLDSSDDLRNSEVSKSQPNDNLGKLKERLSRFIAYDCKSHSSRFVEFWVPVQISNMQLEQYCATLFSNSIPLCSCSRNDPVGVLCDILISTRKCCDHPYIVERSPLLLPKDLSAADLLDFGIKSSGKLQLLDAILSELKIRQLRVLILFQSIGGSGLNSIGDILDDFLRQRFGEDSFERVDARVVNPSKKQAAVNKFNKEKGKFVFLLENRACFPSIKLSSVDAIVIYGSDLNPANDLRALHRISIDSQFEQIKILRLYSSCTVEEKILILAKHNMTLDSNLQNISRSATETLLMWGASYLFKKLDEFHGVNNPGSTANISSEQSLLRDAVKEVLALLSRKGNYNDSSNSIILKAQHGGGIYRTDLPLPGELKIQLADQEQPNFFWTKLLHGRHPRWKYLSLQTQRSRKRVQYFDNSPEKSEVETDEVGKKSKKLIRTSLKHGVKEVKVAMDKGGTYGIPANNGSQSLTTPSHVVTDTIHTFHASRPLFPGDNSLLSEVRKVQSEERTLSDAQRSLHILLKPQISRLCEILKLSEDIKVMACNFLEYVLEKHHVSQEPTSILQAFKISLCWMAASLLKHKIDWKESILLAKQHLDFSCKEEEINYVYSKLRVLKKMFLSRTNNFKESVSLRNQNVSTGDITKEPLEAGEPQSGLSNLQNVKIKIEKGLHKRELADELLSQQDQAFKCKMAEEEIPKSIRQVQRKCEKRMTKLLQKQLVEVEEFRRIWREKRLQLEKDHRMESTLVRSIHRNISMQNDKLKMLENEFATKMERYKHRKDTCFEDLVAKHLAARDEEKHKAANWLAEIKFCTIEDRAHNDLSLHGSETKDEVRHTQASEHRADNGLEHVAPATEHDIEQLPDRNACSTKVSLAATSDIPKIDPNKAVGCSIPAETNSIPANRNSEFDDYVETIFLGRASVARIEQPNNVGNSSDGSENTVYVNPLSSEEQTPDGVPPSFVRGEEAPSEIPETVPNEVVLAVDSLEILTPAVASNVEDEKRNEIVCNASNSMRVHGDSAAGSFNADSPSMGPSLALQDDCSPALTTAETQDEDTTLGGNQCTSQPDNDTPLQPVDAGPIDQSSHKGLLLQPLDRRQQSQCSDLHVDSDEPDLPPTDGLAREPCSEGHISFRNSEASFLLAGNQAELSDQATSRMGGILEVHPPNDTTPLGNNQPYLHSAGRVPNQQSSELQASFQNAETPPQVVEVRTELPNQAVLQTGANLAIMQGFNNFPVHIAHQVASRMSSIPLSADPLQNELERLHKETEQAIKVHEDMKVRLKSECDKEIEEITSQIRKKYEAKLQEAEAGFLVKKTEFDKNQRRVLMNKILAEAFRSKCLDLRPTGALGMVQAIPSTSMQRTHQLSLQPIPRHPVTGLYPAAQPAANQQITGPRPQVKHSTPLFSSTTTRPPQISPITPSTGNLRVGGEIRAPAPHIQPFRPVSMSTASLTSLRCDIPFQQAPNNLHATSHPQLTPPRPPQLSNNPFGPYSRSPQPGTSGGSPALNLSQSAMALLMDIDSCSSAYQPNNLPPLPDFSTNFDSLDLTEFGAPGGEHVSSALSAEGYVVCLSDDD